MNKILKNHKLPNLIQEEIGNPNTFVSFKIIEVVIKNIPTKKTSGPGAFTCEFYQTLKKEIISLPHKHFKEIEEEGILPPHPMRPALPWY